MEDATEKTKGAAGSAPAFDTRASPTRSSGNNVVATPTLPFRELQRQAQRLQFFLLALLGGVVLISTSVFFFLELSRLRLDARNTARDAAMHLHLTVRTYGLDMDRIRDELEQEQEARDTAYIALLDRSGEEIVRLGRPRSGLLSARASVRLPPQAAPFAKLEVEMDETHLYRRLVRVFGIHLLVGGVLALLIYRFPLLALHRAIGELESTHAQLMHTERLSAIGEMYASLAHEINNPLGIILTRAKIMLAAARKGQPRPDLVRDLDMIDRHGTRIAGIIRGLLTFTRKTEFKLTETNLNRVIQEVIALVEKPFVKKGVRIDTAFQPDLPVLRASPPHLQQVFMNLLNNARDAMPKGGCITLRTLQNTRTVVAEVHDTGGGIAPELKGRIFEPFFTTKEVGKGTGLGLSISHGIISAHGGEITVESEPGQGTVVRIKLPLKGANG